MAHLSTVNSSNACKVVVGIEGLQRIAVKSGRTKGGGRVGHSKGKLATRSVQATLTIIHMNAIEIDVFDRFVADTLKLATVTRVTQRHLGEISPRLTQISPA